MMSKTYQEFVNSLYAACRSLRDNDVDCVYIRVNSSYFEIDCIQQMHHITLYNSTIEAFEDVDKQHDISELSELVLKPVEDNILLDINSYLLENVLESVTEILKTAILQIAVYNFDEIDFTFDIKSK